MKTILSIIGLSILLLIGGVQWSKSLQEIDPGVVSARAFHWHSELVIYVKGEKQEIPADIGIGAVHQPVHTHADDNKKGIIHMEFSRAAKKEEVMLGQFFKNWNKDIRSFGTNMKMMVNGEENTEYENYVMRDKDKIELRYE